MEVGGKQHQADRLVVVGAHPHLSNQVGGKQCQADSLVVALNKIREEVSFLLYTKRSGRSLQLGKEEPKDEGGEG